MFCFERVLSYDEAMEFRTEIIEKNGQSVLKTLEYLCQFVCFKRRGGKGVKGVFP